MGRFVGEYRSMVNKWTLVLFLIVLSGWVSQAQEQAPVLGDFGDAPDNLFANYNNLDPLKTATFPSVKDESGEIKYVLHRLPEDELYLGKAVTLEDNGKMLNKDEDDGWVPVSMASCRPAQLLLTLTIPEDATPGPIYLNVLFDWNHDGRWSGGNECPVDDTVLPPGPALGMQAAVPAYNGTTAPEWGVQNLRLDLPPYELQPGFVGNIVLPPILPGALGGEMWTRFTLTTVPVDEASFLPSTLGGEGWDGRGIFQYGETEDYFACVVGIDGPLFSDCPDALAPLPAGVSNAGVEAGNGGDTVNEPPLPEAAPLIDLSLSKTVDNERPNFGDLVTFTITVTNEGTQAASGVSVKDVLPPAFHFFSASATRGSYDGAILWSIGTLAAGESVSLQLAVEITELGTLTNTAQVSSANEQDVDSTPDNNDPNEDDQDSATLLVDEAPADVAITKVDVADPVNLGGALSWTLTVKNNGPFEAANVMVSDPLPSGVIAQSATASQGTCDTTVSCAIGTLPVGATATIDIDVTVDAGFLGSSLTNTATVSADNADPAPTNNSASEDTTVDRESDLVMSKAAAPSPVNAGDTLTWTLTVDNLGPGSAPQVVVNDPLPAGVTLVSATPSQGTCDNTVNCALGTIINGGSATVDITVTVDSGFGVGSLANTATVSSPNNDPVPGNNSASTNTAVTTETDLSLTKSVSPSTAVAGQDTVTWTINVDNNGPSDAENVQISDTLPSGVTFVSASVGCSQAAGTVTCNLGTLAAGASTSVTIDSSVDANAGSPIDNQASVTTTTPEPNTANNSDNAAVTVTTQADVSITKADGQDPTVAGTNLTWTLTANNAGPSDAANVQVSDVLPAGVTLVSAVPSQGSCTGTTAVSCSLGVIAASGNATVDLTVTVDAGFTGSTLSNTATVSTSTTDPNATNDSDTEPTTISDSADVSISKADSPDPVIVGQTLVWTLTVDNAGPSDAAAVQVSDTLPAGVTLNTVTPSQGSCLGTTTITCDLGTITGGGSATVDITVTVDAAFPGTSLSNTATVSSTTPDPNSGNNNATEPTTVTLQADLGITKADDVDPVLAGNTLTYTLDVINNGPSSASNVTISDPLPAGVTFVSASLECTETTGTVTCALGSMANGATAQVTVTVTVNADFTGGSLSNTATVSADEADPVPANNSATEPTTVNTQTNLVLTKTVSPATAVAGQDSVTWTVQVENQGPSDAQNTVISDTLPAGVTFVSADAPCVFSLGDVTCNLGTLAASAIQSFNILTSVDPNASGTIVNPASVTTSTTETTLVDNSDSAQITVTTQADVGITKADSADPVLVGSNITYTLNVTNNGPSDAQNVSVSDPIPANTTFVSAGAGCTQLAGIVTCNAGTLAPLGTAQFTVTVQVDALFAGSSVSNTATVSTSTTDSNPANDSATEPTAVEQGVDLSVTKTDSADPVLAGNQLTYTLTVNNAGPASAANVSVQDTLPTEVTFVSASVGCTEAGGVVTCNLGTLAPGTPQVLTVTVATASNTANGTIVNNTAVVFTDSIDTNLANNSATEPTTVNTQTNLVLTKTVSPATAVAGQDSVTWTVQVENQGPSDAQNTVISDTLPAGVTFVSADAPCVFSLGDVTCNLGTLAASAIQSFNILTSVDPNASGTIVNPASVTTSTTETTLVDNSDSAQITVTTQADVGITKADSADPVLVGSNITYTLNVTNNGPSDAQNVSVSDPIPANTTFVSAGAGCTQLAGVVTCNAGTLAPSGTAQFTVTVQVDALFAGSSVSNTATVSTSTTDSNPANDSATEPTAVEQGVDLSVTKTDSADPVLAGNQLTYTLTVNNAGPGTASGVQVSDTLPAGTTLVSATGTGWSCSGTTTVTCTLSGTLGVASANPITVTVDVDPATASGTILSNTATVSTSSIELNAGNDAATEPTTVNTEADLGIAKTDSTDPVIAGNQLTYTLTVTNNGPSNAASVTVTDTLPAGVTLVSASGTGWSCSGTTIITCTRASASVGVQPDITVTVTVNSDVADLSTLTNTASVITTTTDPVLANDTASEPTTVNTLTDVLVSKTASIGTVRAGESFSYFITVFNNGPSDAQNVQTNDALPLGVLFQAASPDQGTCPTTPLVGTNGTVGCSLGTIPAGGFVTVTVQASVDSAFTGSSIDNTATVTTDTTDSNPGNNTSNVVTIVTQVADISVGVVDNPNQVRAGESLTYILSVVNNGPSDAQNVQLTNPFPSGVTLTSGPTVTVGSGTCTPGATITCSFGTLANQATVEVQYTVLVDQDYPTSSLSNNASATTSTTDTQPGNNSDSTVTTVSRVSDLTVVSLTDSPDPATRGGQLTYTINVSNLGPSQSADATVTVNLASGLTYVSGTPSQGSCTPSGQVVTCSLGAFNSGANATITIVVNVEASAANTVLTNASVSTSASTDPDSSNNSAVVATTIQG